MKAASLKPNFPYNTIHVSYKPPNEQKQKEYANGADTVTPKTLSILTSTVVRAAHHQTPWESRLALVELNIEYTLGYKIASWVM